MYSFLLKLLKLLNGEPADPTVFVTDRGHGGQATALRHATAASGASSPQNLHHPYSRRKASRRAGSWNRSIHDGRRPEFDQLPWHGLEAAV
jgi:hypothetical protein